MSLSVNSWGLELPILTVQFWIRYLVFATLHHFHRLDTRHPLYISYLLQSSAAVRNLQIPSAGQCCSEKCGKKLDTRPGKLDTRPGKLDTRHGKLDTRGRISSRWSWCKPIIQPPTCGLLVDRATYIRTQPWMKSRDPRLRLGSLLFIHGWSSSIWLCQPRDHASIGWITRNIHTVIILNKSR